MKNGKKEKKCKLTLETKEIPLGRSNPDFNLVSLKARHRLNELKKVFTKSDYKDYIRKCKNMYSISSSMNKTNSINDLYIREKSDINDIFSLFKKIDNSQSTRKIKLAVKKRKVRNRLNEKPISSINFYTKLAQLNKFRKNMKKNTNKLILLDKSEGNIQDNDDKSRNKNDITNNFSNLDLNDGANNNNKMNMTNYKNENFQLKLINYKQYHSLKNINNKKQNMPNIIINDNNNKFSKTAYSSLMSNFFHNKASSMKQIDFQDKIAVRLIRNNSDFNRPNEIISKMNAKSCKNNDFKITKYGGIIFNNSIYRKKNIQSFLPDKFNLPFLYHTSKNINTIKEPEKNMI